VFPHAVWTPGQDPGPYITAPLVITRDAETGRRNVGTYRLQVTGPRRLGLYIGTAQDGARHFEQYESLGRDMPVAIVIGADPCVVLSSVTKFAHTVDELDIAGGLRGEPVPLIACETVGLEVPANAEIVLEGVVPCGVREDEGPFGEYTGYMGAAGKSMVVELTAITRRQRPVYQAFLSQMPPSESSCIRSLGRSATLLRHLRGGLGFPVTDVHFPESGGANGIIHVALKKTYPEQVRELAFATWSYMNKEGKILIVVDDDIDIRNAAEITWAMSFRMQPARDMVVQDGMVGIGLDPSIVGVDVPQHDPRRRVGSKLLIDATRKHAYPAAARVPKELMERVRNRWREYGFD
jgi:UbiD family decarboxylase